MEVGKKLLPEANWICADVFEVWRDLPHFDCAIANPPFGRVATAGKAPTYTGPDFEYKIIDIASRIADYGTFLIPQQSAPFRYSGAHYYDERPTDKHTRFHQQTGIDLSIHFPDGR